MIIKEYRITLPMTVEEYQRAQLYSVAKASKLETGGGEGVEIIINEPFTETSGVQPTTPLFYGRYKEGQFTEKVYYLARGRWGEMDPWGEMDQSSFGSKLNPEYMKKNFFIKIESIHLPDRGDNENAHHLSKEALEIREVVNIDIAHDKVSSGDYKDDEDPLKYKSEKTNRGPLLSKTWKQEVEPVMTCYKLVTAEFIWWGLQERVEKIIHKTERRLFTNFHRQVFCWTDQWFGLTMADIRAIEAKTKQELDKQRTTGDVRGMVVRE